MIINILIAFTVFILGPVYLIYNFCNKYFNNLSLYDALCGFFQTDIVIDFLQGSSKNYDIYADEDYKKIKLR